MTGPRKPRLRFFETSSSQRHIEEDDKYLYRREAPRFRFNIIGTGTIGQEHMRVTSLLGAGRVHGIFDERPHSMAVATEEHVRRGETAPVHYADLASACNDPDADALFICTPNHTHINVVEVAAKSGKAIFLEKPMATTLNDARKIVEVAADYPSIIQVGLQYRYKAPYVEARHEILERGAIGGVQTISMCEYRPPFLDKVEQWNKFSRCSGGTLIEKCCHYFDLMNLFAGAEPVRVYASSGQAVNFVDFEREGAASDIDDHGYVIVDYRNGVRGNFTLNMFSPHFFEELVVTGT
ncbi:MAG: Gfo/Idh/MocA family oxidoreductase, partial [Pseudomonadota bacterium]